MPKWKGVILGVNYLHKFSPTIVHGDLKPVSHLTSVNYIYRWHWLVKGNILIDDRLNARICDFGIARILIEEGTSGLTTTSDHTGTERYLAYELVVSDELHLPTTFSDIHALACIGYEVCSTQLIYCQNLRAHPSFSFYNSHMLTERTIFVDKFSKIFVLKFHQLIVRLLFLYHFFRYGIYSKCAGN